MTRHIEVVGAVIIRNGLILCAQRGSGALQGMWEFPGGKIEQGETPRAALEREIAEELLCQVIVGEQVASTTYEYDFGIVTLTTFYCQLVSGEPRLTEHARVAWSTAADLGSFDWAPADIPAVEVIGANSELSSSHLA